MDRDNPSAPGPRLSRRLALSVFGIAVCSIPTHATEADPPPAALPPCEAIQHLGGSISGCDHLTLKVNREILFFFEEGSTRLLRPELAQQIALEAAASFQRYRRILAGEVPGLRLETGKFLLHVVAGAPDAALGETAITLASQRARMVAAMLNAYGVPYDAMALSVGLRPWQINPFDMMPSYSVNVAQVSFVSDCGRDRSKFQPIQP